MRQLLGVELTRLRWRRAVVVLLAACVLIPTLLWAGMAWNTRPFSEEELRQAEQEVARINAGTEGEIARCVERPEDYGIPADGAETMCAEMLDYELSVEEFLYRPQLSVENERGGTGLGVITVLTGLVMLIGTTFAGHDWNSGSMSNQLLFEPRRIRVWGAKALAVLVTGLVVSAVVLGGFWGATWALAEARDLTTSEATWDVVRNTALRSVVLIALAGVAGYALTMFFRSTVATLGVMFAVAIAGNLLIAALLGEQAMRWLLPTNVAAFILNGYEYFDPSIDCANPMEGCEQMATLSLAGGATYLGVLLAVAVGLSLWSFRRRDVP